MVTAPRTPELGSISWSCPCELCLDPWCWRGAVQSFSYTAISFGWDFSSSEPFWCCCLFQSYNKTFKTFWRVSVTLTGGTDAVLFRDVCSWLSDGKPDTSKAATSTCALLQTGEFTCRRASEASQSGGKAPIRPTKASYRPQDANPQEAPGPFSRRDSLFQMTLAPRPAQLLLDHWRDLFLTQLLFHLLQKLNMCRRRNKRLQKKQAWQMHWSVATGNQQPFPPQTHMPSRMLGNWLQTQFCIFIYLFYICSGIFFFYFTSVGFDNLEPDVQESWALTAVTEVKTAGVWAMFDSLKKSVMDSSLGIPNESIALTPASPARPPLPAEGEPLHTSTSLRWSTSELTACQAPAYRYDEHSEKLVRTFIIADSEQVLNSRQ